MWGSDRMDCVKCLASQLPQEVLLGDLGREELCQRAERSLALASSIICGCWLGLFPDVLKGKLVNNSYLCLRKSLALLS